MISVENVTKFYGSFKAVDGLSFSLGKGEIVGFLGPNGAGKTTTMRILTGYLPATSGRCLVDSADVAGEDVAVRRKIGYLPESAALYTDMEVTDFLKYMGGLRSLSGAALDERIKKVVSQCGLKNAVGKKISTLSKGYRQRVGLAQALLHDPEVLVLDEPTVGLDPNQIAEIRNLIRDIGQEKTILLSSHILSEIEQVCNRVLIIAQGKIVAQGTPQELTGASFGAVYYVGYKGPAQCADAVKNLKAFKNVALRESEGGLTRLKVTLGDKADRSEEFYRLAVENNWPLVELRREETTLEEVFTQLTK